MALTVSGPGNPAWGGAIIDTLLSGLQAGVAVKDVEEATDAEKLEACYAVLRLEHKGKPRPGPYYRQAQHVLQSRRPFAALSQVALQACTG